MQEKIHENYWFASVEDCFLNFLREVTQLCNGNNSVCNGKEYFPAIELHGSDSL